MQTTSAGHTSVCCAGCSLLPGGPKSTVKKFMNSAQKGDVDGMNQLFSKRAAAVAAAYNAKFSPTRVGGQPVKVTGVINYNFVAE